MTSRRRLFALLVPLVVLAVPGAGLGRSSATTPPPTPSTAAVPDVPCGPGDHPETTQGRTPAADFASGRSNLGYTCNASLVGHLSSRGGFRVWRYVDSAGHACAFYDSAQIFPTGLLSDSHKLGVYVVDVSDPAHPVLTDNLLTLAMQSPHESLSFNPERGLLAADMGTPATGPGIVDVYDVRQDCRHPQLQSSLLVGNLGHEGAFSPDGKTFWVTSVVGNLTALDLTNPKIPRILYVNLTLRPHGLNISDDGSTLYMADLGSTPYGLTILDVSQIQARKSNPQVPVLARLSWPNVSVPQVPIPVTIKGHPYLIEMDEFDAATSNPAKLAFYDPTSPVGAARIIDIADPRHPFVVSNIRLQVNQPADRAGDERNDPGASVNLGGYTGHYCGVPQRTDPGIVACGFVMSGLRVFDIRDPYHPREIAYFNMPPKTSGGSSATGADDKSQPAFDVARGQIYYADGNTGLYVVQIRPGVWPFR